LCRTAPPPREKKPRV